MRKFCLFLVISTLSGAAGAQVNGRQRWVISAIHADPTPPVGAPHAEYIALFALGDGQGDSLSMEGLRLEWNGQERTLPAQRWPSGTGVVVHRASDSSAFSAWSCPRVAMDAWPALVNGGTTVFLLDSSVQCLDAMTYSESDLGEGGRPWMREDPMACGGSQNARLWSQGDPIELPLEPLGSFVGDQGWMEEAESWSRWMPRGHGHWLWRLPDALDPVSRKQARMFVGSQTAALVWASDSAVEARWSGRLSPLDIHGAVDQWDGQVTLGPLKGCAPGQDGVWLNHRIEHAPSSLSVMPVELLPDPLPDDPLEPEEYVVLFNPNREPVDISTWDWDGGQVRRRHWISGGGSGRLVASDFDGWPGLANSGGTRQVRLSSGREVARWSWSPCDHTTKAQVGKGVPLVRSPEPASAWHSKGQPHTKQAPNVVGFGCQRDWSGHVASIQVHMDRSVDLLPHWSWQLPLGTTIDEVPQRLESHALADAPWSWEIPLPSTLRPHVEWPQKLVLSGQAPWSSAPLEVDIQCPPEPPLAPPCLRIDEALWRGKESGEEFVEVVNCGDIPLDIRGLQGTTEADPLPGDWDPWLAEGIELVLPPGSVMAFGECPRWYSRPAPRRGPSKWKAERWSALSDSEGQLSIRLPRWGLAPLDSVHWSEQLDGPWWLPEEGWSWMRALSGTTDWVASPDGGSPGQPRARLSAPCAGATIEVGDARFEQPPSLTWRFPGAGHELHVDILHWPTGDRLRREKMEETRFEGQWTWDGLDGFGQPVGPGTVIWQAVWSGEQCSGRLWKAVRVPGYRH